MIELVALLALKDESDREIYHLLIFLLFVLRILVALSTLFLPRVTNIKIKINKDSPNIPYLMLHMILLSFAGLLKSCSDNQTNIVIIVLFHVNCLIIINQKFQFSKGVSNANKKEIAQIIEVTPSSNVGKYLGCINIDRSKSTRQLLQ